MYNNIIIWKGVTILNISTPLLYLKNKAIFIQTRHCIYWATSIKKKMQNLHSVMLLQPFIGIKRCQSQIKVVMQWKLT